MNGLKIGNVRLENNVILAPMAGVSDLPFRLLCHEQGAGMVCTEMISAKAILYRNRNTEELLAIHPEEGPVSLQLFGSDPKIVSEMAKRIEERPFAVLDLNMGCPVPKVVNNGEGSALMKNPLLAGAIIEQTVRAIRKPVTVKIRKGFDEAHVNAVEIAHIAQEAGAAAVAVHGRTREQYYSGKADWDIIAQVKAAVKIPVFGNGDVTDGASALRMLSETRCDGVLVGRAARGNPWIFAQILDALEAEERAGRDGPAAEGPEGLLPGGRQCGPAPENQRSGLTPENQQSGSMPGNRQCEPTPENRESGPAPDGRRSGPTPEERLQMILRHASLEAACKGERVAVREMRKHMAWYTAGLPDSARMRRRINEMETMEQLTEGMRELLLA